MSGSGISESTGETASQPVTRRLSAVASTGALKDLRPIPANDVAKRPNGKHPTGTRPTGESGEIEYTQLTSPVTLTPAPRASASKIVANVARRTAHIAMDAFVIVVFAPVIAGWVMIERRRRRTPQV